MVKKVARKVKSVLAPSVAKFVYVLAILLACIVARKLGVDCLPCILEALSQ